MRLTLTKNDGELLATWTMPDTVTETEVDTLIGEGLWQKCRLDRCDGCGGFFPHAELVERHDAHGDRKPFEHRLQLRGLNARHQRFIAEIVKRILRRKRPCCRLLWGEGGGLLFGHGH